MMMNSCTSPCKAGAGDLRLGLGWLWLAGRLMYADVHKSNVDVAVASNSILTSQTYFKLSVTYATKVSYWAQAQEFRICIYFFLRDDLWLTVSLRNHYSTYSTAKRTRYREATPLESSASASAGMVAQKGFEGHTRLTLPGRRAQSRPEEKIPIQAGTLSPW